MHIHRFFRSHRKGLISVAVIMLLAVMSVYQSIYADNDGIPTSTVYWIQDMTAKSMMTATEIRPFRCERKNR